MAQQNQTFDPALHNPRGLRPGMQGWDDTKGYYPGEGPQAGTAGGPGAGATAGREGRGATGAAGSGTAGTGGTGGLNR